MHGMWHFLERPPPSSDLTPLLDQLLGRGSTGRIRCPKCGWQPEKSSRWFCSMCTRGVWNTFDTRGVCPVCSYQWKHTACLRCHAFSLHEDWYERPSTP